MSPPLPPSPPGLVEKYRKLKDNIRNRTKVKQTEKEQREEIFERGRKEGRKEGKEDLLRQIANTSGTRVANAI